MIKLMKFLKPYAIMAILAPLLMVGEVAGDLILPYLMSFIVNYGITGMDIHDAENGSPFAVKLIKIFGGNQFSHIHIILFFGIMMLVITALGGLFGLSCAFFSATAAQGFGRDLRCEAYRKIMSFSIEQTDSYTTGSLITRMTNDITQIMTFVEQLLRGFIRSPMFIIGGFFMLTQLNLSFGFIVICGIPILILILFLVLRKAVPEYEVVQKRLDKVNSVVQENVNGIRVVKAYNREEYERNRFDQANQNLKSVNYHVLKLLAIIPSVLTLLLNFSIIAVIYIGGRQLQISNSGMTTGAIMAAITYVTQIMMQITMATNLLQSISRAEVSAIRVQSVLETRPIIQANLATQDSPFDKKDTKNILSFQNVSFHYPNTTGMPVLKNITLDIHQGETLAIIGATGSGKTTLAALIPRFYDPTSGEIYFHGSSLKTLEPASVRSQIGYVMQKSELVSASFAENIRWGKPDATEAEVLEAAKAAQAATFIQHTPAQFQTTISEKGASLSGGQKQRLSIARALIRKPEILIFDDATSALDLATEASLRKSVRNLLGKQTTIIMIAQRIASVIEADRIAVLENDGTILHCGSHAELLQCSATYRDIYDSQMKSGALQLRKEA